MNRRQFLAGAAAAACAHAQSTEQEAGLAPLFDGKTLAGWTIRDGPDSAFYVDDGAIVVHESAGYPCWLRSARRYENFDFRCEFFVKGWTDSGIYIHAPEHGPPLYCGQQIHLFHAQEKTPGPASMGAIFPLVAPRAINVRNKGEWNALRIRSEGSRLQVWSNGEQIHDLNLDSYPELRVRLRHGYIGIESLSYPIRFRDLRIRELPSTDPWQDLYVTPADLSKWHVSDGKPKFQPLGEVLHASDLGYLATNEKFRDFALETYIRHSLHHNSGILFRTDGTGNRGRHYEIQLHDVEGAHYPTGSLYDFQRAKYPRIQAGEWFLLQMWVKGRHCLVRINGENVMEYDGLENVDPGPIELQAHESGKWTEFKAMRIQTL